MATSSSAIDSTEKGGKLICVPMSTVVELELEDNSTDVSSMELNCVGGGADDLK